MTPEALLARAMEDLVGIQSNRSYLYDWAQLRSKRLLTSISPDSVASIGYRYSVPDVVRRTTGIVQRALRLEANEALGKETAQSLRLAAEVFEHLAELEEGPNRETSVLLAAGLFQLAGYAANSTCVARSIEPDRPPREFTFGAEAQLLDWGIHQVLQRRFVGLLHRVKEVRSRYQMDEDDFIEQLRYHDAPPEAAFALLVAQLRADAFEQLSSHMLTGAAFDPFLNTSGHLREISLGIGDQASLLKTDVLTAIGRRLSRTSVWTELAGHIAHDALWRRYAMLSARGRGASALEARSGAELWESQITALRAGLLSDSNRGLAIRMPTSAGKTRIAELAILDTLSRVPKLQAVYIAPFNALADEVETAMSGIFADLGFRVSSVLGNYYDIDDLEGSLVDSSDLLIITPEKLTLLLRTRPLHFENVGLVVLDEGHIIDSNDRGIGYEILLTRLRQHLPDGARFLFLSAVISDENAADFAEWLCGDPGAVASSEWRPAQRLDGIFNATTNQIVYPFDRADTGGFPAPFVPRVVEPRTYRDYTPKTQSPKEVQFPSNSKRDVTAELAVRFASEGPVIVFTTQPRWAESCAAGIQRALQLRRQTRGVDIPKAFRDVEDLPHPLNSRVVAESWLGSDANVVRALSAGVGVHHGGLPDAVRRAIENDFRAGLLPVLTATGTLAQGVNLPAKTVVIHTLHQYDADADEGDDQRVSLVDFWNTAGRAGRAGAETQGHVIVVTMNNREASRARRYLSQQIPPVRGQLYQLLQSLIEDRLSREEFRANLDSDLLVTLVEETVGTEAEAQFRSLVGDSFVSIQARNTRQSTAKLVETGVETIQQIRTEVPDSHRREAFALTGLDVASCIVIEQRILQDADAIRSLLTESFTQAKDIALTVHRTIGGLNSLSPKDETIENLEDVIQDWLGQVPMPEIIAAYLPSGADVNRFQREVVSDYFGYRLPWGIASFIRIADSALQIGDDISTTAQWLAPMVRHGVSTVQAAWAMTIGCPTRDLSVKIAEAFTEVNVPGAYADFIEWFSSLTSEDFILAMDATPDEAKLLVSRAAALVPSGDRIAEQLRNDTSAFVGDLVGLDYHGRSSRLLAVGPGDSVTLTRDHQNPYDTNAIVVIHESGELGYLPRFVARLIAPQMDAGYTFSALVNEIERGTSPRVEVSIRQTQGN